MTVRLDRCFEELAAQGRRALIAYLCVGDPSLEESTELAVAAAVAGADLLELGVPFSDPTADGPAIARASLRAIRGGATIARVIEVAAAVRARVEAPIVLFGYYNPILVTGEERVVSLAAAAGVDALLVVDLPPEEGAELRRAAAAAGLAVVPLVAPTTGEARIERVLRAPEAGAPRGFVYYVSVTGVTGTAQGGLVEASAQAAALGARSGLPVVVGFGIDGAARAREAAGAPGAGPAGIVVGTALVKRIEEGATAEARLTGVRDLVAELRAALDAPG